LKTFYEANRVPLRLLFTLLGRVRAENLSRLPRKGGVVLVSNHLTMLDPVLLGCLLPRQLHFMAKEELFGVPALGLYLRLAGSFPIRRGAPDREGLRRAEELLRAGEVIMIFPEGHRSRATGAQEARTGAVLLAARTNSPIVPAAITGTERLRLHQPPAEIARGFLSRPEIRMRLGEPFAVARGGGSSARKAAADQVMRRITALLPAEYHGIYAEP
jgi:1-acyl-sn-glycerol-3-phosphate acyltransferase